MKKFLSFPYFLSTLLTIMPFLILSSCSEGLDEDYIPGNKSSNSVMISFDLDKGGQPATYALAGGDERNVSRLDLLLFDMNGKLAHVPIQGTIGASDPATGKYTVTATVPIARYGDIVLVANAEDMLNAALTSLTVGMLMNDAIDLFQLTLTDKWNATSGSAGYKDVPMYGETGLVNVNGTTTNNFSVRLFRMLARVDVYSAVPATTGRETFDLNNIRVYNSEGVGMLATSSVAGKPNLPTSGQKIANPLVYSGAEITNAGVSSVGEIYVLESAIAGTPNTGRLADATCLVVGGYYTPAGDAPNTTVESYYRIDFAMTDFATGTKTFYDILRNHHYNVRIISVSGPGESRPDDALNTEFSRIEVEVIDWGDGGTIGGDINGSDVLLVNPGIVTLPYTEHTGAPGEIGNEVVVSSTHTKGWYISKITESDGTVIAPGGWLDSDIAIDAIQMSEKTITILLDENRGAERVGYIHIASGPSLSYKIKVTQRSVMRIGKIVWEDYDGANDNDPNLTYLLLEDMGGNKYSPVISTIGALPEDIIIDGDVAKVTVVYKDYRLVVPTDKYRHNGAVTLIIEDRSLIGKAVHMDKIRLDMAGSYIQVSDVNLSSIANWAPIGTGASIFIGNYDGGVGVNGDGKGFEIMGLNIDRSNVDYIGLFGVVSGSTFKNIHIASGSVKGKNQVGGVFGRGLNATMTTGCSNAATIEGGGYVGGICGYNGGGTVKDCINAANVTGTFSSVGGVVGQNTGTVINSLNLASASISAELNSAGGIVGYNEGGTITGTPTVITNKGNVTGKGSNVGGITGYNKGGTVEYCSNSAPIKGTGTAPLSSYVSGISGLSQGTSSVITNCKNLTTLATVTGTGEFVGGIAGKHEGTADVGTCTNAANVTGSTYVGGLFGDSAGFIGATCSSSGAITGVSFVGNICGVSSGTITGITNSSPITATGDYIGGIAGQNKAAGALTEKCTNNAEIVGRLGVGGVIGSNSGTVDGCHNASGGDISGTSMHIGGVVGISGGPVNNSTNRGSITGITTAQRIGGIIGYQQPNASADRNINYATVSGASSYVGGIVGLSDGIITRCENAANSTVTNTDTWTGGITGEARGPITGCINRATINGRSQTGGIVGSTIIGKAVNASYNIGNVTGTTMVGAIIGQGVPPTACYFGGAAAGVAAGGGIPFSAVAAPVGWPAPTGDWAPAAGYWQSVGQWSPLVWPTLQP